MNPLLNMGPISKPIPPAVVVITDHGALTGLADDDHTQYHNDDRALTWLASRSTSNLPEGSNLYYLDERVDDRVAALLAAGTGVTLTYNDAGGVLTIAADHKIGGSSTSAAANCVVNVGVKSAVVGNVGSGEDDLQTVTLPANALEAITRGIRITAFGTAAGNANAKTLKLYFGSQLIFSVALTINLANSWRFDAIVLRTGSSTQKWSYMFTDSYAGGAVFGYTGNGTATQTETGTITIKLTGTATSDNDITCEGLLVEMLN